jgi:GMP synthase-like glutamine amidotransferase
MRIHTLEHVPFEGPARIADWAAVRGHRLERARLYQEARLPALDGFDLLVVMGGPMSVNDEAACPWLGPEKRLVADAIEGGRGVFGVCLGAQLICAALGERVYPAAQKEIGWFPVRRAELPPNAGVFSAFPPTLAVLHWHGETFDLPRQAVRLAETDVCPNQAFQVGDRVIGTQFHLEATSESVQALVDNAAADITGGTFQQDPGEIVARTPAAAQAPWPVLFAMLDSVAAKVAPSPSA